MLFGAEDMNDRLVNKRRTNVCARRVHGRAHYIGAEVVLPSYKLHEEHTQESIYRGFLEDVVIV
jgi:hypothetical protein